MTKKLPKDLGGLQKLADHVIVQEGDVWVYRGVPHAEKTEPVKEDENE